MDKILDFFKRHPKATEVFEANGKLFLNRGAAESFAADVKRYTRADLKKGSKKEQVQTEKE